MIQKKKWSDLKTSTNMSYFELGFGYAYNVINTLFENNDARRNMLKMIFGDMASYFYMSYDSTLHTYMYKSTNTSVWDDLDIFISSYKPLASHYFIHKVMFDLGRYLDAYKLLLTNDGFAKHVSYHRFYHSQDEADGNNKNYYSETPQVSSGDQALDNLEYLSNASKDFSHGETSMDSEDTSTQTSTSWEEARKNMEMVYYKDLCRYIIKIPYLVYDFYALDDYPVTYSLKEYYEAVKRSFDF